MDTKKEYTAPELTVVTIKSERGYAASGSTNSLATLWFGGTLFGDLASGNMEAWDFNENDQTFDDNTINW